jgi:hypothetical protein
MEMCEAGEFLGDTSALLPPVRALFPIAAEGKDLWDGKFFAPSAPYLPEPYFFEKCQCPSFRYFGKICGEKCIKLPQRVAPGCELGEIRT